MLKARPDLTIERLACARIPTLEGEFTLCLFRTPTDPKEHLAVIHGDVDGRESILTRIHSECFTGDVLGSLRCDCGEQLERALQLIGEEDAGIVVYLRQEGRGIGLLDKLRAYNLQDQGYDTVDANTMLGHEPDERDYTVAAQILDDLGVRSVRLLTNNPLKVAALRDLGIRVTERVGLQVGLGPDNLSYLMTKARRMKHLLDFAAGDGSANGALQGIDRFRMPELTRRLLGETERPMVTLSYAQSLDGCIAARRGESLLLSGPESMRMTHRLRSAHDAILVGIGTVLVDDPRLTVRLVEGRDPQPIVVDSTLRMPTGANLLMHGRKAPWIVTTDTADDARRRQLEDLGAMVIRVAADQQGRVDLNVMLRRLKDLGIESLMVEGGSRIITSFIALRLVDQVVITVVPQLVGGLRAFSDDPEPSKAGYSRLANVRYQRLGDDIVLWGQPVWDMV